MTFEECVSIVERIRYKPGTDIDIYRPVDRDVLVIHARIPVIELESKQPSKLNMTLTIDALYIERIEAQQLLDMVMHRFEEAEIHEAREWFSYRGERIFNPHAVQRN